MFDLDESDEELVTGFGMILEAQSTLTTLFDKSLQDQCGLSLRWFEVLIRLMRTPGQCMPAGELGRAISLTSGATTRRIDRLVEAGLIERHVRAADARFVDVCLTTAGEQRLAVAVPIHLADLRSHVGSVLTTEQVNTMSNMLRLLRDQESAD